MNTGNVKTGDLNPGQLTVVQLDGKSIALANVAGEYHALDDVCPHRGCSLAAGSLNGALVTCPCHGSQVDVRSGAVFRGPASRGVRAYSVAIHGDEIHVVGLAEPDAETVPEPGSAVAIHGDELHVALPAEPDAQPVPEPGSGVLGN